MSVSRSSETEALLQGWVLYTNAQEGEQWDQAWCVLTDERIMLYSSDNTQSSSVIYSLKLNPFCSLHHGKGDSTGGYEFGLVVGLRHILTFKVKTSQERELWTTRIYQVIISGTLSGMAHPNPAPPDKKNDTPHHRHPPQPSPLPPSPSSDLPTAPHHPAPWAASQPSLPVRRSSLPSPGPSTSPSPHLLPGRKLSLQSVQGRLGVAPPPSPPPPSFFAPSLPPPPLCSSSKRGLAPRDDSGVEDYLEPMSPSFEEDDETDYLEPCETDWKTQSQRGEGGGRWDEMRRHGSNRSQDSGRGSDYFDRDEKESTAQKLSTKAPTWLFENCTRALAEKILKESDPKYGNTLMRCTSVYPGYSISKRWNTQKRGSDPVIEHFKVVKESGGYRFDVNDYPHVMASVEEVMAVFVQQTGAQSTVPMTCNDLPTLGISAHQLLTGQSLNEPPHRPQQPPPLPPRQ